MAPAEESHDRLSVQVLRTSYPNTNTRTIHNFRAVQGGRQRFHLTHTSRRTSWRPHRRGSKCETSTTQHKRTTPSREGSLSAPRSSLLARSTPCGTLQSRNDTLARIEWRGCLVVWLEMRERLREEPPAPASPPLTPSPHACLLALMPPVCRRIDAVFRWCQLPRTTLGRARHPASS